MTDGLRLIEQRKQGRASRVQALCEAVVVGVADIEAGGYNDVLRLPHDSMDLARHAGARSDSADAVG